MVKFGVIGLGPAGCLFLASLPPELQTRNVHVFDSGCIGGDLAAKYGAIRANLTRFQMERAFRKIPAWSSIPLPILSVYAEDECPYLSDVCRQLRVLIAPILTRLTVHTGIHIDKVQKCEDGWRLMYGTPEKDCVVEKVILCTGATPKRLDFPTSAIPLEIALNPALLKSFVSPTDSIVVFGTSHSGTLVLKHLNEIGCTNVVAVYKGPEPFCWHRDGKPEGLKQESAAIADAIVQKTMVPIPRLVSVDQTEDLVRALMMADHVVYAVGFQTRAPTLLDAQGIVVDPTQLSSLGNIWGFGFAFPTSFQTSTGGFAPDIGFEVFVDHISKCMPTILVT